MFAEVKLYFSYISKSLQNFFSAVSPELQVRDLKIVKEKEQFCNSGEIQVTQEELSKYNLGTNVW